MITVSFAGISKDRWPKFRKRKKSAPKAQAAQRRDPGYNIRPDRYPAGVRGKMDYQTGMVLEDRTGYERGLKKLGWEHLS